ncbi:protein of unknown function [Nitrosomonas cryotolerans]|uniref:Nap binding protein NBP1 n=1 Tax=Nitrosomonas cryotolerans ATCC 49181 TaxID=1131553 RepID=A0A1N6J9Z3_9PROT|nr:DUF4124 domain-containing protein [Nitrosomonas cryotolerans]SFQ02878.1 protein of unknown function [Nitrosomonas cryotolerans]SIO41087.1 Nap binding protein NBP1 [Nitrosomonas cryotolerans ATCC 49181]
MRINSIVFITLATLSCSALSEIYKQVDEQGNITYSNIRSENAKEINLPPIVVVPAIDSGDVDSRIKRRTELSRSEEQRKAIEDKISNESSRLEEIKREYNNGMPDRLGSERNYQRYLDRVTRLKEEISMREENLKKFDEELQHSSSSQ